MAWLIITIAIIAIYVFTKYRNDSKYIQKENIHLGGMVKLFPEFVSYFERNGFEFVEDSGTNLIYKKTIPNNQRINQLFIAIESKFTNIIYGYIENQDGKRAKSNNVSFSKNYKPEEVEIIIKQITDEFHVTEHLVQIPKFKESRNNIDKQTKLNNFLTELNNESNDKENTNETVINNIFNSLLAGEQKSEFDRNIEIIESKTKEIKNNPLNKIAYTDRAFARMIINDYLGAIKDFEKVLKFDPNDVDSIENLDLARNNMPKEDLEMHYIMQSNDNKKKDISTETDDNIFSISDILAKPIHSSSITDFKIEIGASSINLFRSRKDDTFYVAEKDKPEVPLAFVSKEIKSIADAKFATISTYIDENGVKYNFLHKIF